jgi:hypothetical protein
MPQRVIVQPFTTEPTIKSLELHQDSILAQALADGWRIVSSSSAAVPGLATLYVTFVLEKATREENTPLTREEILAGQR